MLDAIRTFFRERMNPAAANGEAESGPAAPAKGPEPLHVAACALLLELAYADEHFTDAERNHIHAVLQRHSSLDAATAHDLMRFAEAERKNSVDVFQFANLVRSSYDVGQKTVLAEIMWSLILTDGEIARHESY